MASQIAGAHAWARLLLLNVRDALKVNLYVVRCPHVRPVCAFDLQHHAKSSLLQRLVKGRVAIPVDGVTR